MVQGETAFAAVLWLYILFYFCAAYLCQSSGKNRKNLQSVVELRLSASPSKSPSSVKDNSHACNLHAGILYWLHYCFVPPNCCTACRHSLVLKQQRCKSPRTLLLSTVVPPLYPPRCPRRAFTLSNPSLSHQHSLARNHVATVRNPRRVSI